MIRLRFLSALICAVTLAAGTASAATLKTLKSFCATGGNACTDGSVPRGTLVSDASGTLYGSTQGGGAYGAGTIFTLTPNADRSAWTHKIIRNFCPNTDCSGGGVPKGRLVIDVDGNIYGTTTFGGHDAGGALPGSGTVFKLTTDHKLVVLYRFCVEHDCADGAQPEAGLTYAGQASGAPYDGTSPLYGTTSIGGTNSPKGTVFEITFSGGTATHKTIYNFCSAASCTDGFAPYSSLTVDGSGNILGTTLAGGAHEAGVIYRLAPTGGGNWTETVLHSFCAEFRCSDGGLPRSGVLIDGTGAMFGMADSSQRGERAVGVIYRMSGAQYAVLHTFCRRKKANCADGSKPEGDMAMDQAGNLFGVTQWGGANSKKRGGTVFRMSGDSYKVLYSFCAKRKCHDGGDPLNGIVLGPSGTLIGTTGGGGQNGQGGTVFELTP